MLLHPNSSLAREWIEPGRECFSLATNDEGLSSIRLESPGMIAVRRKSGQVDKIKVTDDGELFELDPVEFVAIRVYKPLGVSLDSLLVLSIELRDSSHVKTRATNENTRASLLFMIAPSDIRSAAYRAKGIKQQSAFRLEKWVPTLRSIHGR